MKTPYWTAYHTVIWIGKARLQRLHVLHLPLLLHVNQICATTSCCEQSVIDIAFLLLSPATFWNRHNTGRALFTNDYIEEIEFHLIKFGAYCQMDLARFYSHVPSIFGDHNNYGGHT